jgi:hypothetical protein
VVAVEFVNLDDVIAGGFKRGELFAPLSIPVVTIPYDTITLISDIEVSQERMETWVEAFARIGKEESQTDTPK